MNKINWHGWIGGALFSAFLVAMALGVVQKSHHFYTIEQVYRLQQAMKQGSALHIPVWVGGEVNTARMEKQIHYFSLSDGTRNISMTLSDVAHGADLMKEGAKITLHGRIPTCDFSAADCLFEAQAAFPQGSISRFFYMGGYGFYVWMAYGLVIVVLVSNLWIPILHRQQLLASLSRRRRQAERKLAE